MEEASIIGIDLAKRSLQLQWPVRRHPSGPRPRTTLPGPRIAGGSRVNPGLGGP